MLGPFGAGVLSVLIPQVRDDLGTTTAAVTAGIAALQGAVNAFLSALPLTVISLGGRGGGLDAGRRGLGARVVRAREPGGRGRARQPRGRVGYSAFRFAGLALAPVIWLPLFHADPQLPFLVAGALSLLVCPLVLRIGPAGYGPQ